MPTPEALLISAVLTNKTKAPLAKANFTSDNMAKYSDEMFFILNHRTIPSRKVFKSKYREFIIHKVPSSDMEILIQQCKSNKIRLDTTKLLADTVKQLQYGKANYEKILSNLEIESRNINAQFANVMDIDVMDNLDMYVRRYVDKRNKVKNNKTVGIPYGMKTLDRLTGGMQNKELITVAARTGIGKSWLMCNCGASAIMSGNTPLYLSLEMDWDAIANRIFTIISYELSRKRTSGSVKAKKTQDIEEVLLNDDLNLGRIDERKVVNFLKKIKQEITASLYVPDIRGKFSIAASQQRVQSLEPDVVFFDYFGLTQSGSLKNGDSGWAQAAEASHTAKEIARIYDIPYVLGAQINRSGANSERPENKHIALTDSIGQDSDKVFILTAKQKKEIEIHCDKFRGSIDNWGIIIEFDVNRGKLDERRSYGLDNK